MVARLDKEHYQAFISSDCPVSMIQTVSEARRLSKRDKTASLIVVPAEKFSEKYLSMQKLLTHNNMDFVDDEAWRKEKLPEKPKLPILIQLKEKRSVEVASRRVR